MDHLQPLCVRDVAALIGAATSRTWRRSAGLPGMLTGNCGRMKTGFSVALFGAPSQIAPTGQSCCFPPKSLDALPPGIAPLVGVPPWRARPLFAALPRLSGCVPAAVCSPLLPRALCGRPASGLWFVSGPSPPLGCARGFPALPSVARLPGFTGHNCPGFVWQSPRGKMPAAGSGGPPGLQNSRSWPRRWAPVAAVPPVVGRGGQLRGCAASAAQTPPSGPLPARCCRLPARRPPCRWPPHAAAWAGLRPSGARSAPLRSLKSARAAPRPSAAASVRLGGGLPGFPACGRRPARLRPGSATRAGLAGLLRCPHGRGCRLRRLGKEERVQKTPLGSSIGALGRVFRAPHGHLMVTTWPRQTVQNRVPIPLPALL